MKGEGGGQMEGEWGGIWKERGEGQMEGEWQTDGRRGGKERWKERGEDRWKDGESSYSLAVNRDTVFPQIHAGAFIFSRRLNYLNAIS